MARKCDYGYNGTMTLKEREELLHHARNIRRMILEMTTEAGSGHVGGSLSVADILTILFFRVMRHRPDDPSWEERDRFILSAGHLCPAYYATLAETGYIPKSELATLRKINSRLQGHPSRNDLPIVETSTGSLGQGISVALGMALALKLDKSKSKVYCITSDGEQEEGSTWETAMAASHYRADNLIQIIDRNNLQTDGSTETVIGLSPLRDKYQSFGWSVIETNGHNFPELLTAFDQAFEVANKPVVIIAHTTMGKGISSIENDYSWHSKVFKPAQVDNALEEINKSYERELKGNDV